MSDHENHPGELAVTTPEEVAGAVPPGAVVVGIDGSGSSRVALAWAVAEAVRVDAPLHLLCAREAYIGAAYLDAHVVWNDPHLQELDGSAEVVAAARAQVKKLAPKLPVTVSLPWGRPAQHLVAASHAARLVVVGSRGRSPLAGALLGTVSLQTAGHAASPVVVVREQVTHEHPGGSMRVVVGVDGSRDSADAVRFALETAGAGGQVELVTSWWLEVVDGAVVTTPGSPGWETVTQRLTDMQRRALAELPAPSPGVHVTHRVERGHTEDVLLRAAEDADLLAVGSRGRGGFAGLLLGSVSQHMLAHAPCPVAVMVGEDAR